ncbi:Iron-containing redox enzyme [Streptomyces sp. yr375]|uniref:iron-containing redox enzyme family protein n=1 Tax=Streptomyces sp. yr375 TaxID=1761906 RepID=UPI0008AEB8F8|nr:iron-containing redox enzyme family protein [Streptomyces sp. yr375]SES05000.1 Iron-containing redox enzyme [Streptomyces sp. yr375]
MTASAGPTTAAGFPLPDLTTSLPRAPFAGDPVAVAEAAALRTAPPGELLRRLLSDQESATALLLARHVLAAFLPEPDADTADTDIGADDIAALVGGVRDELAADLGRLRDAVPATRRAVLRQRAPLALLTGCWLDTVSQPATQPSVVVNRLFGQHFRLLGAGNPQRGLPRLRRRALEDLGVFLPEIETADFLHKAGARPLTEWHGCFQLALSRLPAAFLPELVGVHYALLALGVDDLLTGADAFLPETELRETLAEYLEFTRDAPTGPEDRRRLLAGVTLVLRLEREHVAALTELAAWHDGLSPDARVAAIVARHAPFAGRQHRAVRIGKERLTDWFADPEQLDLAAFMREFRASRQLRPTADGSCRFLQSIKFGGPMFGIFDEQEAADFTAWAAAIAAGDPPDLDFRPCTAGDEQAAVWSAALAASTPDDIVTVPAAPAPADDREFFHRLVNIEHFPHLLPHARERAEAGLAAAEELFEHGTEGRHTDASWFEYTPEALLERVDRIYWDKLVDPYRPLTEIPDRDEVVFGQKTFALGSLIDGTWAYRIGNLGRRHRDGDTMLFSIYADEMGRGDLAKNHITIIHQVLASMSVHLPHIRQDAFLDQDELPDHLYGFSIHQISLALFPDSLYNEILGYNLGIEMFGLGQMRLHEIQKLRAHHFDIAYEEAHLSIDNLSAGHARQSAEIIVGHLDGVRRDAGPEAVRREWRRIWRGYASFAHFVEHELVKRLRTAPPAAAADLVI